MELDRVGRRHERRVYERLERRQEGCSPRSIIVSPRGGQEREPSKLRISFESIGTCFKFVHIGRVLVSAENDNLLGEGGGGRGGARRRGLGLESRNDRVLAPGVHKLREGDIDLAVRLGDLRAVRKQTNEA